MNPQLGGAMVAAAVVIDWTHRRPDLTRRAYAALICNDATAPDTPENDFKCARNVVDALIENPEQLVECINTIRATEAGKRVALCAWDYLKCNPDLRMRVYNDFNHSDDSGKASPPMIERCVRFDGNTGFILGVYSRSELKSEGAREELAGQWWCVPLRLRRSDLFSKRATQTYFAAFRGSKAAKGEHDDYLVTRYKETGDLQFRKDQKPDSWWFTRILSSSTNTWVLQKPLCRVTPAKLQHI